MRGLTPEDNGKKVNIVHEGEVFEDLEIYLENNKYYLLSHYAELDGFRPNELPYNYPYAWCIEDGTINGIHSYMFGNISSMKFINEEKVAEIKKETVKQDKKMVTHKFETNNRLVTLGLSNIEFNDYGIVMTVRDPNDVVETDDVLKQVEFEQKARQIVKSTLEGRVRKQKFISTFTTDMMSRAIAKGYLIELEHRIKKDFNSYVPLGKKAK